MKIFVTKEVTYVEGLNFDQYGLVKAENKAKAYELVHNIQESEELHSELIDVTEVTEVEAKTMEKVGINYI